MKKFALLLLLAGAASAEDIAIHNVTRTGRELTALFEDPPPPATLALDATRWAALCFKGVDQQPMLIKVTRASHRAENGNDEASDFSNTPTVSLALDGDVVECQTVEVTLLTQKFPSGRWMRPAKKVETNAPGASAAEGSGTSLWSSLFKPHKDSNKDPDYSLSGTVVAGVGSKPLYTIDGTFKTKIAGGATPVTMIETVKTASSASVDPDSFNWALTLLHAGKPWRRNIFSINSKLYSLEFDKSSNVLNEVSSGGFAWTRVETAGCGDDVLCSMEITLGGGVELGDNLKNQFAVINQPGRGGSGLIFRGVPSARLAFVYPTSNPKHAIRFTSTYTLRLPARDELFLETRLHTQNPVPLLETNPRHSLENDLTFKITDYFAFKIQHTYGSLPPTFKFLDHRVSTGIVFQADQAR